MQKIEAQGMQTDLSWLPSLVPWLEDVYQAYWQLDTLRQLVEGGMGRIPWDKREDKLDRLGVEDEEDREEILDLWQQLEHEHLKWGRERSEEMMQAAKRGH